MKYFGCFDKVKWGYVKIYTQGEDKSILFTSTVVNITIFSDAGKSAHDFLRKK